VDDGLAQGLGRDRAGVDADAADHVAAIDQGDPLAQLGGLDRRLLAGGPGTDHHEVVVVRHVTVIGAGHSVLSDAMVCSSLHSSLPRCTNSNMRSADKALRILSLFDEAHPERGVTELSRLIGVHKSTASRMLTAMEMRGFVTRVGDRYRLGPELVRLGTLA